ncbi:MAG: hypothetical protein ACI9QC_000594 [Oceanicoccus sp.]|jgi:hypothetical protein
MKKKIKSWVKRYLPTEMVSTFCALLFPTIASFFTGSILLIALVGSVAEMSGFYSIMIIQESLETRREYMKSNRPYGLGAFLKGLRNLFLEFGPAEFIYAVLVTPAVLYLSLSTFNNLQLGLFVGLMVSNVSFYIPAIISFELRKLYLKD